MLVVGSVSDVSGFVFFLSLATSFCMISWVMNELWDGLSWVGLGWLAGRHNILCMMDVVKSKYMFLSISISCAKYFRRMVMLVSSGNAFSFTPNPDRYFVK